MNRIRYALCRDNPAPVLFEDPPANIRSAIEREVIAVSAHAYSQPLMENRRPKHIWGDLHMFFDMSEGGSSVVRLSDANDFLARQQVALGDVRVYSLPMRIEVVVKAECFRGEVGSPCRPQFDHYVQEQCNSSAMPYRLINGHHVEFSEIPVLTASGFGKSKLPYALPSLDPRSSGISLLSQLYYNFHSKLGGKKDLLTPKLAWTRNCSVLNALLCAPSATVQELATICSLFRNRIDILAVVLSLHRRADLLPQGIARELKKEVRKQRTCLCVDAPTKLSALGNKFPCSKDCAVSSPAVLPFKPWSPKLGAPVGRSFGGCTLDEQGLNFFNETNRSSTKIMEPVWVKRLLHGVDGELGSREVMCQDSYGFPRVLVIGEEDLNSPRLFAILRSNGVHVPISKTEQGKIREYLVSQFPITPSMFTGTSHFGWQQDKSYIDLNSNNSLIGSPYRAKALAVPNTDYVDPASIKVSNITTDRFVLLAILASLTGPVLRPLNLRGVCVHFYGATEEARKTLLYSASSIRGDRVYSLEKAKKSIRDLKRQYSDSTLCIGGATSKDVGAMRAFVKRFFLGRKNSDEGVTAVIISAGEKPLAQSRNQRDGVNAFTVGKDVLAIDIRVSHSSETACPVKGLGAALIEELSFNRTDTLGNIRAEQYDLAAKFQRSQKSELNQSVANFLWLFASLGYWARGEGEIGWWGGDSLPMVFQDMVSKIDDNESDYFKHLKLIADDIPQKISIGPMEVENLTSCGDIGRGRLLVPSTRMNELIDHRGVLKDFLKWLRANKVLITQNGKSCGNYHHPQSKKTVRGYALWIKRILHLTTQS